MLASLLDVTLDPSDFATTALLRNNEHPQKNIKETKLTHLTDYQSLKKLWPSPFPLHIEPQQAHYTYQHLQGDDRCAIKTYTATSGRSSSVSSDKAQVGVSTLKIYQKRRKKNEGTKWM